MGYRGLHAAISSYKQVLTQILCPCLEPLISTSFTCTPRLRHILHSVASSSREQGIATLPQLYQESIVGMIAAKMPWLPDIWETATVEARSFLRGVC